MKHREQLQAPEIIETATPREAREIIRKLERDGWKSTRYSFRERELYRAGKTIIVKGY